MADPAISNLQKPTLRMRSAREKNAERKRGAEEDRRRKNTAGVRASRRPMAKERNTAQKVAENRFVGWRRNVFRRVGTEFSLLKHRGNSGRWWLKEKLLITRSCRLLSIYDMSDPPIKSYYVVTKEGRRRYNKNHFSWKFRRNLVEQLSRCFLGGLDCRLLPTNIWAR